jgi:hypothetical protein
MSGSAEVKLDGATYNAAPGSAAIDTDATAAVAIRVTWAAADPANTITLTQLVPELL